MKNKFLILILALGLSSAESVAQGFGLGLKAGLNFANQDISVDAAQNFDVSSKTGYHFGAYAKLMISENFGIQPEAYYSVQGSEYTFDGTASAIKSGYLQVPVLARIGFAKFFNIHAGPQFGILLSNKDDILGDIKDQTKGSDFAIAAGVGIDLPLGLNGAVRYVHGLSDVNDDGSGSEIKNSMIQISVGFDLIGVGD